MSGLPQLCIFGPPELLGPGGEIARFRTQKQLGLLVFLYVDARIRGASRDALVELLWSDVSPANGRHSLSQACTAIRSVLGPAALDRRGDALVLSAPISSDLDTLSADADGPINLAQPLRGLDQCAGPEFAHWVDGARIRLLRQAREALLATLGKARTAGAVQLAHRAAHLLLQIDPVCVPAVLVAAERTLLDGDTIGAIRLLRDYTGRVESEVGSVPHPEIPRLLRRLERGEGMPTTLGGEPGSAARPRREVFVGREHHMAVLEAAWARVAEDNCLGCLVTGPPGIGKSSLLRRFATSVAARAAPVFVVPCQEIGQGIPFAAVADLIRAVGHDPAVGGTDPLWLAEASRVSPGLRTLYPGIPEPPEAPADSVRLRVAEALHRMLEVASEGMPVLVAFDDVQHMDHASREVIFLLTRSLERARMMLMASARTDEPRRAATIDELAGRGFAWRERIDLEPLEVEQAVLLIDQLTDTVGPVGHAVRDKIIALAQGNPFHIEMLLEDYRQHTAASLVGSAEMGAAAPVRWQPPETLRLAFARLYSGLPRESQHVMHVLAIAGRAMEPGDIGRLLGLDARSVDREVLEIVERGVVRVDGARVDFKTDLHRAYVYWAVPLEARKYHHGKLGAFLASGAGPQNFQRLLEASHHFVPAGMRAEAIAAAQAGAEVAVAQGAMREAERALQTLFRAYPELREHHRLAILLATALLAEGQFQNALEALPSAEDEMTDPLLAALSAGIRAEALHRGRLAEDSRIGPAAVRAANAAQLAGSDTALARALQLQAEFASDLGDLDELITAADAAKHLADKATEENGQALAAFTTAYCLLSLGQFDKAAIAFEAVAQPLEALSLKVELRRALNGFGMADTATGRFDRAIRSFRAAARLAAQLGDRVSESNTWSNLATLFHDLGLYQAASEACCRAISLHLGTPSSRVSVDPFVNAALLAVDMGGFEEAELLLEMAHVSAKRSRLWLDQMSVLLARAQLALAQAEPEKAWPLVDEALSITRGRRHLGHMDLGLYCRLGVQYVISTQGVEALKSTHHAVLRDRGWFRLADRLELDAFLGRRRQTPNGLRDSDAAIEMMIERKLFGRLGRLHSAAPEFLAGNPSESTAQRVVRLFLDASQELPRSAEFLQASAEHERSS